MVKYHKSNRILPRKYMECNTKVTVRYWESTGKVLGRTGNVPRNYVESTLESTGRKLGK